MTTLPRDWHYVIVTHDPYGNKIPERFQLVNGNGDWVYDPPIDGKPAEITTEFVNREADANYGRPKSFCSARLQMTCLLCGKEVWCLIIPESHYLNQNNLTGMYNLQVPTGYWKCSKYQGCGGVFHEEL